MFELNDPKTLQISPLEGPFSRTSNLITQFVYKVANWIKIIDIHKEEQQGYLYIINK